MLNYTIPEVVSLPSLTPPLHSIKKRAGYPSSTTPLTPAVQVAFDEMLEKAMMLIEPCAIFVAFNIKNRTPQKTTLEHSNFVIDSAQVTKLLRNSEAVLLFMATIGLKLEEEVRSLFSQDESVKGFLLDAMGSELADEVANELHHNIIPSRIKDLNYVITPRFSPGYGDWPVTVQSEFLEVCHGHEIGISVTESSLLIPQKSVSAVFGLETKK